MKTDRLITNIIDQVKEAQLKLGYVKETVRLYYPLASLNTLLDTWYTDPAQMTEALEDAGISGRLPGEIAFGHHKDRIEVRISPETAEYIHRETPEPEFLKALIRLFSDHHAPAREDLLGLFTSFSEDAVYEPMPESADFDYVLYFPDKQPDEYYYCIKEEMGHTIYHRFMKEDYDAFREDYLRCYAKISLPAIAHNIDEVRRHLSDDTKILAVVKANAYGHGAVKVSRMLENRVDYFAVATIEEALTLREHAIRTPILILGYTSPRQYGRLVAADVTQTIYDTETAAALNETAGLLHKRAKIHIALDTGMTRIGFQITETSADQIAAICRLPHLEAEGIFTHFSCADQFDQTFSYDQKEKFDRMIACLEERGVQIPLKHIGNSAGIMELPDCHYNMVRSGIVTYGLYPSEEVHKEVLDLIPAMEWKCHVIHVKEVEAGRHVSYGGTFVTSRPLTRIATISAGYADGYPRALSSKGQVLIRGKRAPILGRVCMDQIMVDVTDIPDVQVEDEVTLIGRDGDACISVEEVADPAGRFNYEMICLLSERVPRLY